MRWVIAAGAAMLTAGCTAPPAPAALELRGRIEGPGAAPVDVRLLLQPEHRRDGDRYLRAAMATLTACRAWLGASPRAELTLVDPPWRSAPPMPAGAVLLDRTPWWSARTSMTPELAAARAASRQYLHDRFDTAALPSWFVEGIAEYVARRAMLPLFEVDNTAPGYAFLEERYAGGFIPWFIRIRLLIETDGEPVSSYRKNAGVGMSDPRPADLRTLAGKTVLALATLERWVGRPVFDQIVAEFVGASGTDPPTLQAFARTADNVSGQELSWLFDEVFGSSHVFDYGVGLLTSDQGGDGAFNTVVIVRRFGDARFTGASAPPIGPYQSGRGITLRVTFEDGRQVTDAWDGRDPETTFRYRSPSRAVSAVVDPDRTLLLDLQQTNNGLTLAPRSGAFASRWAALWLAWLEHALLTYSTFV